MKSNLIAISGPRHSRRSELYAHLQTRIQSDITDRQVFCIGAPNWNLKSPLLWDERQWEKAPSTRVISLWPDLNEHCVKKVRHLLDSGAIIISLGLGLDAVLNAAVGPNFTLDDDGVKEALAVHEGIVDTRIKKQGMSPPNPYIIMDADPRKVCERMAKASPQLAAVPVETRLKFVQYERALIDRYFADLPGQRAVRINGEEPVEQMYARCLNIIRESVTLKAVA